MGDKISALQKDSARVSQGLIDGSASEQSLVTEIDKKSQEFRNKVEGMNSKIKELEFNIQMGKKEASEVKAELESSLRKRTELDCEIVQLRD